MTATGHHSDAKTDAHSGSVSRRYTPVVDAESRLRRYAEKVDARLDALLQHRGGEPSELFAAMRYAVLSPGKRLRPALCMASATAVGGDEDDGLDAGCAIELVHCFSLIHDDLPAIDNDAMRRGRPTCHIEYGEALAILAGDALFALAFEILASSARTSEAGLKAICILAGASGPRGLVGGEVADVLAEGQPPGDTDVRSIHERKTGALIRAACEIGGLYGGGTESEVRNLGDFGRHAGLAFQISDDLLNELSTSAALGKSAGSDRERKKATYPSQFGIEGSKRKASEEVQAALNALRFEGHRGEDLRVFASYVVERLR